MAEKHTVDDRSNDKAVRTTDRGTADTHEAAHPAHVDPAEEVMNSNPNLSPPIHPRPN